MTQVAERAIPSARTSRAMSPIIRARVTLAAAVADAGCARPRSRVSSGWASPRRSSSSGASPASRRSARRRLPCATATARQARRALTASLSGGAAVAVCVNGRFAPTLSSLDGLPKGVQVLSLEAALASIRRWSSRIWPSSRTSRPGVHRAEHRVPARRRSSYRLRRTRSSRRPSKSCSPRSQRASPPCRIPGCSWWPAKPARRGSWSGTSGAASPSATP